MKNTTKKKILTVVLFYVFFSLLYRVVLWVYSGGYDRDGFWGWMNLRDYWLDSGMQYLFYFFASLLIWFLAIYTLKNQKTILQIVIVIILIPIVVYFIREGRYAFMDSIGAVRFKGSGTIWDWYIPSLFRTIQFGCLFAYRYFKENQKKIELEAKLRNAALKSELSAIKAQLNPHFLYNIFNTISASVPSENEKTRHLIAELSDLFRYQLKASQTELVPLKEELNFVKKYLDLEKERFQERLEIEIDVDDSVLDEMIPPMLLQPLVENSVKHGLASLIDGGKITIAIHKIKDKLLFEISDTGVGIKDKSEVFEKGVGLNNTRLRLEKMYESTLHLTDNYPQGLKVSFEL